MQQLPSVQPASKLHLKPLVLATCIALNVMAAAQVQAAACPADTICGPGSAGSMLVQEHDTTGNVIGGYAQAFDEPVTASNNTVKISAKAAKVYGGYAETVAAAASATANTVEVSGSAQVAMLFGGFSNSESHATASDNTVTIAGGRVETVHGGRAESQRAATANGNTVNISGGEVTGAVFGGYAYGGSGATASGNTVAITGGKITGNVTGGYATTDDIATTTGNTVRISGAPVFAEGVILRGGDGFSDTGKPVDLRTGNTLEIATTGVAVKNIANFQQLRFYLPGTIRAGDTLLTLTDTAGADIRTPAGQAATRIGVGMLGGGTALAKGEQITLIRADDGLQTDGSLTNSTEGMVGISKLYTFGLGASANALTATVTDIQASDVAIRKSPAEGQASAASLALQGGDLLSGKGMSQARQAADSAQNGISGFAAASGSSTRNKTGSHIDVNGYSLVAGVSRLLPLAQGHAVAGVFFEAGSSHYSAFNKTADGSRVRADGESDYTGAGVLGRYEFASAALAGLYVEGAVRAGNLKSDYRSGDLNPQLGVASYDVSVAYWGAHAGLGKVWQLGPSASVDLYGRYYWTRTGGADVRLFGDAVSLEAVTSHRTRVGARYDWALAGQVRPYVDLAWEHEFDGDARSVVAGETVAAPSLKGSSALGEIGLRFTPSARLPLAMDIGVQGWAGQREGVAATLKFNYAY